MQELGGSTARQPAQAGQWKYSTPWTSCSVYEWGLAGEVGIYSFFSLICAFKSFLVWEFDFLGEFCKIHDLGVPRSRLRLTANCSLGGKKNCVVYSLFCIYIIIISSSSSRSFSISFVALLNCISTHKSYLLSISPPHPAVGEGEG